MENKGENKTLVKIGNFIDRIGIIQNILNIYKNTWKNLKIYVHIYTHAHKYTTSINFVVELQKKYMKIRTEYLYI